MPQPESYEPFYQTAEYLEQDSRLLPAATLYDVDEQKLYAAMLHRLAMPIDGQPSPFSNMAPGMAHSLLVGAIAYMQGLLGHQLNVKPWREMIQHFRLMGIQLAGTEYSILSIVFVGRVGATIPAGTEVRSQYNSALSVYTTQPGVIPTEGRITIPARLNRLGRIPDIRVGEFTNLPRSMSQIDSVFNSGVVSEGREAETVVEAVVRAREQFKTGLRAVTTRDYYRFAIDLGAKKATVLTGLQKGSRGYFGDLVTVVVYPRENTPSVRRGFEGASDKLQGHVAGGRLDVVEADVIPINGTVKVKADPQLTQYEIFNRSAAAIRDRLNPPHGNWGDPDFPQSLATTLEYVDGIYAVPEVSLKHAETNVPLSDLDIAPWTLCEVQQSLVIELDR